MVQELTKEHPINGFYIERDNGSLIGYNSKNEPTIYPKGTTPINFKGIPFEDANKKDVFEKILQLRSKAGWWAYKHGFPFYGYKILNKNKRNKQKEDDFGKKVRANYLGQESWYDTDNFFWIKFDELSDYICAQLRISNHKTKHSKYFETHYQPKHIDCGCVLNLMIGGNNTLHPFEPSPSVDGAVISIDALYLPGDDELYDDDLNAHLANKNNWSRKEISYDRRRTWVNQFVKDVLSGIQRKITIHDVKKYICPYPSIRCTKDGINVNLTDDVIKPNQFMSNNMRSNLNVLRASVPKWVGISDNAIDINNLQIIDAFINPETYEYYDVAIDTTTNKMYAIDDKKEYAYKEKAPLENARLGVNNKKRGRSRGANIDINSINLEDRFVLDPSQRIEIINTNTTTNNATNENYIRKIIIRLTESELNKIIEHSVRMILLN